MPKLYITEFASLTNSAGVGHAQESAQAAKLPAIGTQVVTYTTASVQSQALGTDTRFVRVHTDGASHITAGDNPTATVNHARLAGDSTEYFGVTPGHKIAAIASV